MSQQPIIPQFSQPISTSFAAPEEVEGHLLRRVDAAPGAEHRAPAAARRGVAARRILRRPNVSGDALGVGEIRRKCWKMMENDDKLHENFNCTILCFLLGMSQLIKGLLFQ